MITVLTLKGIPFMPRMSRAAVLEIFFNDVKKRENSKWFVKRRTTKSKALKWNGKGTSSSSSKIEMREIRYFFSVVYTNRTFPYTDTYGRSLQ